MRKAKIREGDLIQVNEDGPAGWFRCILVVDEVVVGARVRAYCISPTLTSSRDVYASLGWHEFEPLGVKSKFVAVEAAEAGGAS